MVDFGKKAEGYRERLGIKQNALAQRVGLSPAHLNRIERGTRKPPHVEVVLAMVEALYLKPEEAKEFVELAGYSPQVLQLSGAQAATQAVPTQQLPPAAGVDGGVLQQILMLLQQLTGTVGQLTAAIVQLQAQVTALQQPQTTPPADDPPQDPEEEEGESLVEQSSGEDLGGKGSIVTEDEEGRGRESKGEKPLRSWKELKELSYREAEKSFRRTEEELKAFSPCPIRAVSREEFERL
jgi:transcriptional regulator with XRE-family HTH domain